MQCVAAIFERYEHGQIPLTEKDACESRNDVLQDERCKKNPCDMMEESNSIYASHADDYGSRKAQSVKLLNKSGDRQNSKKGDQKKMLDNPVRTEPPDIFFILRRLSECHSNPSLSVYNVSPDLQKYLE
jgi:hypothetical protein